jgi:hypothetical protein
MWATLSLLFFLIVTVTANSVCYSDTFENIAAREERVGRLFREKEGRAPQRVRKFGSHDLSLSLKRFKSIGANGGWDIDETTSYFLDEGLTIAIFALIHHQSLINFGAGKGHYEIFLDELGYTGSKYSLDAAPSVENLTKGAVHYGDLTLPLSLPPHDWVLSLEVAEHIPPQFEAVFMTNLIKHTKYGIIISWAPLQQRGHGHVNLKSKAEVVELFEKYGFRDCPDLSKFLGSKAKIPFLARNVLVFLPHQCSCPSKSASL